MKYPCLIPVRGGSKRLPNKWELPWDGVPMLEHCITQVRQCPSVERIIVSSDSHEVLALAKACDAECIVEEQIPDAASDGGSTIAKTMAFVRQQAKLSASYLMLVQCTSPFVNPVDLEALANTARARSGLHIHEVMHLSVYRNAQTTLGMEFFKAGVIGVPASYVGCEFSPTGMGYIFGPKASWPTGSRYAVIQQAPPCDINTLEDYQQALKLRADWRIYEMDKHAS